MLSSPSLVAALAVASPQIRSLPLSVQRQIAQAGDVAGPGRYVVTGAPHGLNVRPSASLSNTPVAVVPEGSIGTSDGTTDNGFAYVQWDTGPAGWSSVAYLAPEGAATVTTSNDSPVSAPSAAELPAGSYVVVTETDPLNLRASPAIADGNVLATIPKGATVTATGKNQNYFAEVTYQGIKGWAAAKYLTPASSIQQSGDGVLLLTKADVVQLRTILAAWANATTGAPAYGTPDDFADTAAATQRQQDEVAAFQKWSNANRGTSLRTDGFVDAETRAALNAWGTDAIATAASGGPSPTGLPTLPPANPVVTDGADGTPVAVSDKPSGSSGASSLLPILLLGGAALFFVLEEKKRRAA